MSVSPETQSTTGVVELREDVPLKPYNASPGFCSGGPRLIIGAFSALTIAITIALFTQIYYGDYQIVPHGSVSSSAAECSSIGTNILRDGGGAIDAAIASSLCLAVVAPHRTSLDASGSLLFWEYRKSPTEQPTLIEWGGIQNASSPSISPAPRLIVALAALHKTYGVIPWSKLLQPAIDLASTGYNISTGLSIAAASQVEPGYITGSTRKEPLLASYLQLLQHNTSTELCTTWPCEALAPITSAAVPAGPWRVWTGTAGARAATALAAALVPAPLTALDGFQRVVSSLQAQAITAAGNWPSGVASGLAVVDPQDTYVALVTGLSVPFGSGNITGDGWKQDLPSSPLDLAPAILIDEFVCGTRYVMGAESLSALAEGAAAALIEGPLNIVDAVESARVAVGAGGTLALEPDRLLPPAALATLLNGVPLNATLPLAALNLVQQRGDELLSHADSRGGGLASRF
ncbi:glutathione hydrolase 6-like isoform X2 [Colias croceus]|uniref:glutathione hydrolase 6-like isoform X2 n=1 Tax=Colias crocea TaxID=72248 RepID=UPI001E27AE7F|nr:glutathione hydrolase 6-like isoform X2 [Colias croceus]